MARDYLFLCFIRVIYNKGQFYCILNILGFWRLGKGWPTSLQFRRMQLLLSESLNKRTKLTVWQQATIEITPMITLLLRVHTTYIWVQIFAHIPFVVNRAFNVTPRSGNKTIHCKIFAKTGNLLEKVQIKLMMSHLQQLFTLHWYRWQA